MLLGHCHRENIKKKEESEETLKFAVTIWPRIEVHSMLQNASKDFDNGLLKKLLSSIGEDFSSK